MFSDVAQETGYREGGPVCQFSESLLHKLLKRYKGVRWKENIIDAVDLLFVEFIVITDLGAMVVMTSDGLNDVMGEVGPG